MSRIQHSKSGRAMPPLERLDARTLRENITTSLAKHGIPHSTRQAVSNISRRRLFVEPLEDHDQPPDDVLL